MNYITKTFHDFPIYIKEDQEGTMWFHAVSVCKALGLNEEGVTTHLKTRVPSEHRTKMRVNTHRSVNVVDEQGLYYLVFASCKPRAIAFKEWVFSEVLPSIRKHGMYIEDDLLEDYEQLKENFLRLQNEYRGACSENKTLKNRIEFLDEKVKTVDSVCISQISNKLNISAKKANQILSELGLIAHFIKGWNCTIIGRQYGFDCVGSDGNFYVRYNIESASKIYALLKDYLEDQEG